MGVVYKLTPKIKEFILQQKKKNPRLSCRKTVLLVQKKFHITISKSSLNNIIKYAGLSSSVGRTRKKARRSEELPNLGTFLLKAADLCIGGSLAINEAIKRRLPKQDNLSLLQSLIYLPLFEINLEFSPSRLPASLCSLVNKEIYKKDLSSYLINLQSVIALNSDISNAILKISREVWFIKFTLQDNSLLYFDAEMHTVWSTPRIPYDFSSTLYKTKSYINNRLGDDWLFNLFTAPGYDTPTKEFFNLLLGINAQENKLIKITLYGKAMEELQIFDIRDYQHIYYIFSIWPWQFTKSRKISVNSEFKTFYFEPLDLTYYVAETEIELSQPITQQTVKLRGCAVKINPEGKTRFIIATNLSRETYHLEDVIFLYLNRWPQPEGIFTDFSRKIELFTYTASAHRVISMEKLNFDGSQTEGPSRILNYYLRYLEAFLRCHIMPSGYEELDFSTTKERFFGLKARIKIKKDYHLVIFKPPKDYPFIKELVLICQRINEKFIILYDGKRLWLQVN